MRHYLDFEEKIALVENKIMSLQEENNKHIGLNFTKEINGLKAKHKDLLKETYSKLTPWQKVAVARHQDRPKLKDYLENMITDFVSLSGDRLFAEDGAVIGGLGKLGSKTVMVIGIEKGNDLESRIKHNFGMPKPEGYRKVQRLIELADRLEIPVVTLIDTPGAYPGLEAEERGQGEAIAQSTAMSLKVKTPLVNVIIGEGGSGGAVALASGDYVMMLEHSVYSVISPEGCASILWRNDKMAAEAAEHLGLTAQVLHKNNIINEIIKEPLGGAHRDQEQTIKNVKEALINAINFLSKISPKDRKIQKQNRYLNIGKEIA